MTAMAALTAASGDRQVDPVKEGASVILEEAVDTVVSSLTKDEYVQAIFLKGSMGRNEHDEFSDIDLYCLVNAEDLDLFLPNRMRHIRAYKELLFYDEIFIVAPQILAVYENLVHLDLFTVTEENYVAKDFIKVLHDPDGRLAPLAAKQNLALEPAEFQDAVDDAVWFLYQYHAASRRGNDLWSIQTLHNAMTNLSKALLHKFKPERAQLGMKDMERFLPEEPLAAVKRIYAHMTPEHHKQACRFMVDLMLREEAWIFAHVPFPLKIKPLWDAMKKTGSADPRTNA